MSAALSETLLGGTESGLVSVSKDGQRVGSFMVPLEPETALESTNHESSNGKLLKTHLLAQQDFPLSPLLITPDRYAGARLSYSYGKPPTKYLLKPIRELSVANALYNNRAGEESTSRARRYAYPVASQSFLRFGRRNKRPRDGKDTAFLRFGRSQTQDRTAEYDNSVDSTGLP